MDGDVLRRVESAAPWSLLRSGWLSPAEAARAATELTPFFAASYALGFADYGRASRWDRPSRDRILPKLLDPLLDGIFFLDEREESPALQRALLAYLVRKGPFVALEGGFGRLPEALAPRLRVACGEPVREVRVLADRRVSVTTDRETLITPRCVLAVPATAARALLVEPTAPERALVAATYAPTVVAAFGLRGPLPAELANLYGLLFTRTDRRLIGSLSFTRDARVVVTASTAAAPSMLDEGDDTVLDRFVGEIAARFPSLAALLARAVVYRWREAIPRSPVGRAVAVRAYRRRIDPARPLRLAGDYTSYPNTESAAWSGWWAATSLARA